MHPTETGRSGEVAPIQVWMQRSTEDLMDFPTYGYSRLAGILERADHGQHGTELLKRVASYRYIAARYEIPSRINYFTAAKESYLKLERAGVSDWVGFTRCVLARIKAFDDPARGATSFQGVNFLQEVVDSARRAYEKGEESAPINWAKTITELARLYRGEITLVRRALQAWDEFCVKPGVDYVGEEGTRVEFDAMSARLVADQWKSSLLLEHAHLDPSFLAEAKRLATQALRFDDFSSVYSYVQVTMALASMPQRLRSSAVADARAALEAHKRVAVPSDDSLLREIDAYVHSSQGAYVPWDKFYTGGLVGVDLPVISPLVSTPTPVRRLE